MRDRLDRAQAAYGETQWVLAGEREEHCRRQLQLTAVETELAETRASAEAALSATQTSLTSERHFPEDFLRRMEAMASRSCQPDDLDLSDEQVEPLDAALRQIFAGSPACFSEEARAIAILRYVSTALVLDQCMGTGSDVLKENRGICGGMAAAFVALCRRTGLPARKASMYNLSAMGGHAVALVHYDGGWHFFDPTFGTFFYSADQYPAAGQIASLEQLLVDPEPWKMFRVTAHPWSGKYGTAPATEPIQLVEDSFLRERFGFVLSQQYRQFFHEAFPIEGRKGRTLSYPLHIDLDATQSASLGTENASDLDLWEAGHYDLSPYGFHTLIIRGAKGCQVRIEYVASGESMPALITVPLAAARLLNSGACDNRYVAQLDVNADEAIVAVFAGEAVPLDSIAVSKDKMIATPGSASPPHASSHGHSAHWHRHWRKHHGSHGNHRPPEPRQTQLPATLPL
jgi:hypothetical protein